MVNRPLKDRRPLGPFFDTSSSGTTDGASHSSDEEVHFDSLDDLPDSPMLEEYIERQASYLNKDVEDIINSKPVRTYMKRLGVWEKAVEKN